LADEMDSVVFPGPIAESVNMLKRVEIKNFRSCRDVVLDDLGPMTVLVGRNASGKTNILQGIQWAAEAATGNEISSDVLQDRFVSLDVVLNGNAYRYSLSANWLSHLLGNEPKAISESLEQSSDDGPNRKIFERNGKKVLLFFPEKTQMTIGSSAPCMSAICTLMSADSPIVNAIRPFVSFLEKVRYYSLDANNEVSEPIAEIRYNKWLTSFRGEHNPGGSAILRLLYIFFNELSQLNEIKSIIGPNGLRLVHDIDLNTFGQDQESFYWLTFSPNAASNSLSFSQLSTGTQRLIQLIVSLVFDQSSVMLIEHPEDSIHQGLLRKLIDVLRTYSDQNQLILSSHSSVVFNTLDPKAVRLVTMEDGKTKVRALTPVELQAAAKFMEEEGSLSEFIETVEEE
jgi:predicted ATPase